MFAEDGRALRSSLQEGLSGRGRGISRPGTCCVKGELSPVPERASNMAPGSWKAWGGLPGKRGRSPGPWLQGG